MHLLLLLVLSVLGIVFESHPSKRSRKTEAILMAIVLSLFAGLRGYSVGIDVKSYVAYFYQDINLTIKDILTLNTSFAQATDPVFHCFLHLLSYISKDPQIMLFSIGILLSIALVYYAYTESSSIYVVVLFFITLRIFPFTLTGLRQTMAMSFLLFALVEIKKSHSISFFVLTFVAALFHSSAILFLVAFPLIKIQRTKELIISVSTVILADIVSRYALSSWLASLVFSNKYAHYYSTLSFEKGSFSSTFLVVGAIFIFGCIYRERICVINKEHDENLRLGIVAVSLSVVGQMIPSMFRLSYYFMIVLFPMFNDILKATLSHKSYLIVIWLASILLIAQYLILGPGAGTEPYVFFWM